MRQNRFILCLVLFIVLGAACSPAETQGNPPEAIPTTPLSIENTATPFVDVTATRVSADSLNSSTAAPTATAQAVATSRGPNLEATDPTTVSLASGGVQFIEFFRFT
jgi:hypothetical protein